MDIILASESKYKKKLLLRILNEFYQIAPDINETPDPGESAPDLAIRLALQKGVTLLENNSDSIIISSDQVAEINGELILKPSSKQQATEQLKKQSGNKVIFYTCLCVTKFGPKKGLVQYHKLNITKVKFRHLSHEQIDSYLAWDKPYSSTGSFKAESKGIALFEEITSKDPTALMGLPLINLVSILTKLKVNILK
jgi:septum formation protein